MKNKLIAGTLAVILGLGSLTPAALARANEKRAHNVAIGATAAAAYLLTKHKTRTVGLLAAGGAAYAWKKHHDAVKQRHNRQRRAYYYRSRTHHRVARYSRAR